MSHLPPISQEMWTQALGPKSPHESWTQVRPGPGDGTQFWPCSHTTAAVAMETWKRATGEDQDDLLGAPASNRCRDVEAPACRAGGVILFDYRVIHSGLPSLGRDRPVAYVVCSTGGALDGNFPEERIRDTTPDMVREFVFWDELDFVQ